MNIRLRPSPHMLDLRPRTIAQVHDRRASLTFYALGFCFGCVAAAAYLIFHP
jgi:hypothetical protein